MGTLVCMTPSGSRNESTRVLSVPKHAFVQECYNSRTITSTKLEVQNLASTETPDKNVNPTYSPQSPNIGNLLFSQTVEKILKLLILAE